MEQVKRESILDAAVRTFVRHGFKKSSIDEIAREARVAKGTVYLACESKEDLFYQAVHREVRAWVAVVSRLIDPRVRADVLMAQIGQAALEYLDARPLVRDLLFGACHDILPTWTDRLDELKTLGRAPIEEL